jgi:hypothetical protein
MRPQGHPEHPSSIYHILKAIWCYSKENTTVYIYEFTQLSCKLLPLCPEGTYLRSIAAEANDLNYVIHACNDLLIDTSDKGIRLQRLVFELCPLGNVHCPRAFHELALAVE